MQRHLPELAPWTRWCHAAAAEVDLPGGGIHQVDRGAEQGDPHGSVQCGVVLADVARDALEEFKQRASRESAGYFDFWYCDDGQVVCRPEDVDLYLQCFDAAAARRGATRGEGGTSRAPCGSSDTPTPCRL